jgi:hypothetical protein
MFAGCGEPTCKDGNPSLVVKCLDEDELGKGKWDKGEWETRKNCSQCREMILHPQFGGGEYELELLESRHSFMVEFLI